MSDEETKGEKEPPLSETNPELHAENVATGKVPADDDKSTTPPKRRL
jgi:hypothetical protein